MAGKRRNPVNRYTEEVKDDARGIENKWKEKKCLKSRSSLEINVRGEGKQENK